MAAFEVWVINIESHWPEGSFIWSHYQDQIEWTAPPTAEVDELIASDLVSSGVSQTPYETYEPPYDDTAEQMATAVSVSMDVAWFFAQVIVFEEDIAVLVAADINHQNVEIESLYPRGPPWDEDYAVIHDPSSLIVADRNIDVADTLDVAITDSSVLEKFEGIEGLVASNYSTFQGSVESLEPGVLSIEDYSTPSVTDIVFLLAERDISVSDTISVAVDETSQVDIPGEVIEVLIAADLNYGQPQNLDAFWKPQELTTENDFNVAIEHAFADREINVNDSVDVAISESTQVDILGEAIEAIIAASYSSFQGDVESLPPETLEEYTHVSILDVSWYFAPVVEEEFIFTYGVRIT